MEDSPVLAPLTLPTIVGWILLVAVSLVAWFFARLPILGAARTKHMERWSLSQVASPTPDIWLATILLAAPLFLVFLLLDVIMLNQLSIMVIGSLDVLMHKIWTTVGFDQGPLYMVWSVVNQLGLLLLISRLVAHKLIQSEVRHISENALNTLLVSEA
jgi:hypothetical protein